MNENNFIEEPLIHQDEVYGINVDKTVFNVYQYIVKYKNLKYKVLTSNAIKVTKDYKFIFVCENTPNNNSYTQLDKELDNIDVYNNISNKLTLASYNMNLDERKVFQEVLFYGIKKYCMAKTLNVSIYGIKKIYYSCMLKIARKLDLEIATDGELNKEVQILYDNEKYRKKILFQDI